MSNESSPTSREDARLKLRLAWLHLEREEREREYQLGRKLELKRIETEAKKSVGHPIAV